MGPLGSRELAAKCTIEGEIEGEGHVQGTDFNEALFDTLLKEC